METVNGSNNGHKVNPWRYRFDGFEIDPANRLLLRDGKTIPLTGKIFDTLLFFAENPGRLLEKDELIEEVWPGDFVEEGNLARNVSTLRKALGDTGKEQRYITTVQGRGYRFVAEVGKSLTSDLEMTSNDAGHNRLPSIRTGRFWLISISSVVLLGLVLVVLQMGFSPTKKDFAFENIRQMKLTQDGNVVSPVISADGQYMTYVELSGNDQGLCVLQIATGSVLKLLPKRPGTRYWGVAIAHDNSFVYYILKGENADYGTLYRIPLLGGQPRKLIDMVAGGLALSPDGGRIALTRIDRQAGTASIVVINNDGSDERSISSVQLDSGYYSLDWSPDARSLIYSLKQHEAERDYWYIAEIPAVGGPEKQIGERTETKIISAKWLPDKAGLLVNAVDKATRQSQIYYLSYPDGNKRRVTNDLNNYYSISMTADARSIVTAQSNSNRQIWSLPGGDGSRAIQITAGTEKHFDAAEWLRNDYIVFDEDDSGSYDHYNIWRMRPDGSERQQLTFGTGNNGQPTVAPDGNSIVFVSRRSGKSQLWRMNADGNVLTQLTDLPNDISEPHFSKDGQAIHFCVSDAGKKQIWRTSVSGGEAAPVIDADVYDWAISPDGRQLAYTFFDNEAAKVQARIHRLDGGGPDRVLEIMPETFILWENDGRALYFNTAVDEVRNVWRLELNGSDPRPITDFKNDLIFRCAWSPEGKQLACIRHTKTFDAVMIRFE